MGFMWDTTPEDAFDAMTTAYIVALKQAAGMVIASRAPQIENWMRRNAPWQDRTGNARQSLHVVVEIMSDVVVMTLAHGMTYGFWLETRWAGRYAIIAPALDHWTPIIIADMQKLFGGVQGYVASDVESTGL